MSTLNQTDFDFNFSGTERAALLSEADETIRSLLSELSDTKQGGASSADDAASRLLTQLNREVAELGAYPEILELKEDHFTAHGLTVPPRFKDMSQQARFYWLRLPLTLAPMENYPFTKLECAVEFNPGVNEGHLRPTAQMILPDRKFQQLLAVNDSLELRIGENFEFEATTGNVKLAAGAGKTEAEAGVEAKAAAQLGFVAGPFVHRVKKALLEHSPTGTEKVIWRLADAQFFQEDAPTLIVVLRVPNAVQKVEISAALQAYHEFNLWAADLSAVVSYFSDRLKNFFRQGAPTRDTRVWDITPSL